MLFSLLVPVLLLQFVSCSEQVDVKPFTYTHLLTGQNRKIWVIDHYAFTRDGKIVSNEALAPCVKDDQHIFYANNEHGFDILNGSTKCAPEEGDVLVSDSWTYINASATLLIQLDFFPYGQLPYIVRSLEEDEMVLEIFLDAEATVSYRFYFKATSEE